MNRYYLRIMTDDKPGVLSTITNLLLKLAYQLKKYCNYQSAKSNSPIPILITTHKIQREILTDVINTLEDNEFVKEKITILPIHDD